MARTRSVTVALRSGVSDATLPNNRKMVAGKTYAIAIDDFAKISRAPRQSVIEEAVFNTSPYIIGEFDGTNYAKDLSVSTYHNTVALPPIYAGSSKKEVVGATKYGLDGSVFKLVLLSSDGTLGNVASTTTKNVAVWVSKNANTVTVKTSAAGNASADFAGVFIAATTAGRYGWIQIAGDVDAAAADSGVNAGDPLSVSTTDGVFTSARKDESVVLDLTGATGYGAGDSFTLTVGGQVTSAFVNGTNAAASDLQTGLAALSTVGAGNVTVTGTTNTGPFTITFGGALSGTDVPALTLTGVTGFTGGTVVTTAGGGDANANQPVVGSALTDSAATKSDVVLRGPRIRNFGRRNRDLFTSSRA